MAESNESHNDYRVYVWLILAATVLATLACESAPVYRAIEVVFDIYEAWFYEALSEDEDQASPNDAVPTLPRIPSQTAGENSSGPLKPVVFHNQGSQPFTVQPWTYVLGDIASPFPSTVSTAVFPASSGSMLLPLGVYTWCYWWELGDINNDGMIEYAHAMDERPVTLDESDSDDLEFAETVDLSAPADSVLFGLCGLDVSPFVVEQHHVDTISGAYIGLAHNGDYVTLRGPITFMWWFIHAEVQIAPGIAFETTTPEVVTLLTGETMTFELVEYRGDHMGDWNLYIWLISVDE